jgi:AcrR family transcriptional regulator
MGIQDRKSRDREALRRKIIDAAVALFREQGYANVSMRKIAKRIEYSVGTLYLYYRDKDELFLAVQQHAFDQAFAFMQKALTSADSLDRIHQMGERYILFGLRYPDLYQLMFMMENPMDALGEEAGWKPGIKLHELLVGIVRECIADGHFADDDPAQISFTLWSLVHGMVSLKISQRLRIYEGDHVEGLCLSEGSEQMILDAYSHAMKLMQHNHH